MEKTEIKREQELARVMIDNDKERDEDFIQYENMIHGIWDLPSGLPAWVGKSVNTLGHDAVYAPTRILSSLEPEITFYPLASDINTRERANMIEQVMKWQLWGARKRRHSSLITEIVQSCIMYHAVAVEIIDLDYQRKLRQSLNIPDEKFNKIRRYGRFAFNAYNPRFIHAQYSQYGVERILKAMAKPAYEIWKEFGDTAEAIKGDALSSDKTVYYKLYDLIDDENRTIWLEPYNKGIGEGDGKDVIIIMPPTPHKMNFIPWSVRCGGSGLETEEKYKYHGVLASVLWFGQWENINLIDSLKTSKAKATAGAPDAIEVGNNPHSTTDINYDEPFELIKVTPGNELRPFSPPQIDPRLLEVSNDIRAQVMKSTVPGVLQNEDLPAGMAYATFNLQIQNALSVIKPYQEMAERTIEDICEGMLLSVHYSGIPLKAFNWDVRNPDTFGQEYIIESDTIYPDGLYFEVKLLPDVPSDQMVKLQAAIQAVQGLGISKEDAIEEYGIKNAMGTMNKRYEEMLLENEINLVIARKQAELNAEIQQMVAEQQMAMQEAMANSNPQGVEGAEGMNPAQGYPPPAMVNPSATREMQSGVTRTGQTAKRGL